jgi:hypothetical protein
MFLSDDQWSLLEPLLATLSTRGRSSLDKRLILENIFWKLTSLQPWYAIPSTSPSWQTCYQNFQRWQHNGTWKNILQVLHSDLLQRGGLDLEQALQHEVITLEKEHLGHLVITYQPELESTWQLTTAFLLIHLFLHERKRL